MPRRALLALLAAVVAFAGWDLVRVRRDPPPSEAQAPKPAVEPPTEAAEPPPLPPEVALDREHHPGAIADEAQILSHFNKAIDWLSRAWQDDFGIDFQVATYASKDLPIEQLAADTLSLRRVGEAAPTGGILVMLNPERREARIEVSYQLEGALPDALVGRIAEDQLAPYAASGAAGMAVMDVLHFLKDHVYLRAIRGGLELDERYRAREGYSEREAFLSGGAGASVEIPDLAALGERDPKAPVPADERARYAPSSDPLVSVEALVRVQRDLAGDPGLELFTEGSRCMRRDAPFAPYQELERAQRLEASRPWRVAQQGDFAVVSSERPAHGFVPVLLQRVGDRWRVDQVETWKNLFFDSKGGYRLVNANTPYAFLLRAWGEAGTHDVAAWQLEGVPIADVRGALGARDGALYEYLQGELLFRNCFLALDAMAHYEKAVRLAPTAPLFLETLGDRASYLGFLELALRSYARMGAEGLAKLARTYERLGQLDKAIVQATKRVQRDPYDPEALRVLAGYLRRNGDEVRAEMFLQRIAGLADDPLRRSPPLTLTLDPPAPVYEIDRPTTVGRTEVYDHAFFSLTLANPSGRPVEVEKVAAITVGTGNKSGLGDIRRYWRWPTPHRLAPGESLSFDKVWGFTVDTDHDQLSYLFDVCWRGEGDERQCRFSRLDLMPR